MKPNKKIAEPFRQKLEALDDDQTVCAIVALESQQSKTTARPTRQERRARMSAVNAETEKAMDALNVMIRAQGGKVLGVSRPLSMVTIEARRALIEQLSKSNIVKAIMENQAITGIDPL